MKIVDLSSSQPDLTDLLEMASQENVVLRTREGKEFVLAEADDLDREISLIRENRPLMDFLDKRSREKANLSLSEVKDLLNVKP